MTKDVSRWEVEELINEGKVVYALDREDKEVVLVNTMSVKGFFRLKEQNDSLFWIDEEMQEEK